MPLFLSSMWYILESVQQSYDLSDRLIRAISHWQLADHGADDVACLLEQGADVNKLHGTLLPLHCACMTGDAVIVDLLLQRGAQVALWGFFLIILHLVFVFILFYLLIYMKLHMTLYIMCKNSENDAKLQFSRKSCG